MVLNDFLTSTSTVTTYFSDAAGDAAPYVLAILGVTLIVGIGMALLGRAEKKVVAKFKG